MAGRTEWIPVEISDGMFSNEYAVNIKTAEGRQVSLFADKELIREEKDRAFLKVLCISLQNGIRTVLLPSETFETLTRWVNVAT